jgi:hypothetical protein
MNFLHPDGTLRWDAVKATAKAAEALIDAAIA